MNYIDNQKLVALRGMMVSATVLVVVCIVLIMVY